MSASPLERAADALFAAVRRLDPAAQAHVVASTSRVNNTRFAASELTTNGSVASPEVALTVVLGARHARATQTRTDAAALEALAARALAMAKLAPEDSEAMPVLGPQSYGPSLPSYDDATAAFSHGARAELAKAALAVAERRGVVGSGFVETESVETLVATSEGLRASRRATRASLTTTARTVDGTGSGWAGADSHLVRELDATKLAETACAKALASRSPTPLAPGRYTVVLEPAAVAELLSFLVASLDARSADEGRSFFTKAGAGTRVGERLFAPAIHLTSDPASDLTPSSPFDDEGLPLRRTAWIEGGVLRQLAYSRYWAQKRGVAPTGSHARVLLRGGDAASTDALVAQVKRGLLVTRLWYTRWVDPQAILITGLTRDGLFLIEHGKVTRPVSNFRFNESPVTMLARCTGLTRETFRAPHEGGLRVPALACEGFHMASVSQAV